MGVPCLEGTTSCSLLFFSLSRKYSSNSLFGDKATPWPWRPFRPCLPGGGATLAFGEAKGGGEVMFAGTRNWPPPEVAGEGSPGTDVSGSLVSNTTSPGPSTSSPNPIGNRWRAPYPSTAPRAPSPPQSLLGINSTSRTTSNSLLYTQRVKLRFRWSSTSSPKADSPRKVPLGVPRM